MSEESQKSKRLLSLDVFRGITIAGMLIVNNPGTWSAVYPPLEHAKWHGLTPTDLIFPFFLFIMGIAMPFSFEKRIAAGADTTKLLMHAVKRSIILILIGLFLNSNLLTDLPNLRWYGVLQRIGIVYFFVSLIVLKFKTKGRYIFGFSLIAIYWILLKFIPLPGYGTGNLTQEGNIIGYVDRLIFSKEHLWLGNFDPEGLISNLTAIVTSLIGYFLGDFIRKNKGKHLNITNNLFVNGTVMMIIGYILTIWFPINKNLWTISYVFVTAGMGASLLGLCYWLIEIKQITFWIKPFLVLGLNAITVYFLAELFNEILDILSINGLSLKEIIYKNIFAPIGTALNSMEFASLLYALFFLIFWIIIMNIFYKKKIFIKI